MVDFLGLLPKVVVKDQAGGLIFLPCFSLFGFNSPLVWFAVRSSFDHANVCGEVVVDHSEDMIHVFFCIHFLWLIDVLVKMVTVEDQFVSKDIYINREAIL